MDKRAVFKRYGDYFDAVQKLGRIVGWERVTVKDLSPSRGEAQRAYKEMKELNFEGTIIDFFCWVSLEFLVYLVNIVTAPIGMPDRGYIYAFAHFLRSHGEDVQNVFRLASTNKKLLLDVLAREEQILTPEELREQLTMYISGAIIFEREAGVMVRTFTHAGGKNQWFSGKSIA